MDKFQHIPNSRKNFKYFTNICQLIVLWILWSRQLKLKFSKDITFHKKWKRRKLFPLVLPMRILQKASLCCYLLIENRNNFTYFRPEYWQQTLDNVQQQIELSDEKSNECFTTGGVVRREVKFFLISYRRLKI